MLLLQGNRADLALATTPVVNIDVTDLAPGGSFDTAWSAWAEGHAAARYRALPQGDDHPLHLYDLLPSDILGSLDWVTLQCAAITKILPGNRCDSDLVLRFAATYREPGLRRIVDDIRRHPPN